MNVIMTCRISGKTCNVGDVLEYTEKIDENTWCLMKRAKVRVTDPDVLNFLSHNHTGTLQAGGVILYVIQAPFAPEQNTLNCTYKVE